MAARAGEVADGQVRRVRHGHHPFRLGARGGPFERIGLERIVALMAAQAQARADLAVEFGGVAGLVLARPMVALAGQGGAPVGADAVTAGARLQVDAARAAIAVRERRQRAVADGGRIVFRSCGSARSGCRARRRRSCRRGSSRTASSAGARADRTGPARRDTTCRSRASCWWRWWENATRKALASSASSVGAGPFLWQPPQKLISGKVPLAWQRAQATWPSSALPPFGPWQPPQSPFAPSSARAWRARTRRGIRPVSRTVGTTAFPASWCESTNGR